MYATHVSRSRKPASQRRAPEGPGLTRVAAVALAKRRVYFALLIAACASFCAWFSAALTDC